MAAPGPTPVQQAVIDFLAACEHASTAAIAGRLYDSRRPPALARAATVLDRMEGLGLVRSVPVPSTGGPTATTWMLP